jgi:hypothetical protein
VDLPTHPDTDAPHTDDQRRPSTGTAWGARIAIFVVAALIVLVIVLHLTGVVGPGAH